jgi:polyisoprenoid-binding protein YceI
VTKIGEGKDPWGGHRAGFEGHATINRSDFGIDKNLGPASEQVEIMLSIEGIRK